MKQGRSVGVPRQRSQALFQRKQAEFGAVDLDIKTVGGIPFDQGRAFAHVGCQRDAFPVALNETFCVHHLEYANGDAFRLKWQNGNEKDQQRCECT